MTSRRLRVTVEGPSGAHLVSVPEDARISDLLPGLVEACEGGRDAAGWRLAPRGEAPMEAGRTLGEIGLFDGAILELVAPEAVVAEPAPRHVAPPPPLFDSMGELAYRRVLDGAIAAPGARASAVIAVVALHPGAGATTVTALLATLLRSLRSEPICAVDANPESGALSHWLVPDSALPADAYRSMFEPGAAPAEVAGALVVAASGLAVLPAPLDTSLARNADPAAWSRLIDHLRHLHQVVLLDCGAGLQRDAARAAIAAADQVVLVNKPRPSAPESLDAAVESLRRRGKPVVVVSNEARRRERVRRVESGVQQVTLAFEPRAAAGLKRRGFAWGEAPAAWQEAVRELAAVLVASG
jgi:MinD-like ATPase involved in chromosome partitioning or flagellar assembly